VTNGYMAVSQLELWQWMKEFIPEEDKGFSWSNHPNINQIAIKMESLSNPPGNSGLSFAITMRHLECIAKKGLDQYKTKVMSSA